MAGDFTDDFSEFWKLWPGRWNKETGKTTKVGKYQAGLRWAKLSAETKSFILRLLKSGRIKAAGTQYLPDAFRWLDKHRWEDFS